MRRWLIVLVSLCVFNAARTLSADHFTYVTEEGREATVEASLYASGQGAHALLLPDGQMEIIPQAAVKKRVPGEAPQPLTPDEMVAALTEKFGDGNIRLATRGPYVVGVVLAAPLPKASERRTEATLKKAAGYMALIESTFERFAKEIRLPLVDPTFPLVVLIFETDEIFNEYTADGARGGLSAQNIAGFYSPGTNWLAIRMGECRNFATPLHEAIHQLCFNRGVFKRLAPVPTWFGEGIATGFEGDGNRVKVGPSKISSLYARQVVDRNTAALSWDDIVRDNRTFRGDVLAGEAYMHAWSLHWLLVTRHKDEYGDYIKALNGLEPFAETNPDSQLARFERAFGQKPLTLQSEFQKVFPPALKRQRVSLKVPGERPGYAIHEKNSALIHLTAVNQINVAGSRMEVQGAIRNTSPIRPLTYHVTVETDTGTYAEWLIPNLAINKSAPLKKQIANKLMKGGRGGIGQTFFVRVRTAMPGSDDDKAWQQGKLPVPQYRALFR